MQAKRPAATARSTTMGGRVRVVAGTYLVICLAVGAFAVYARSVDPTTFQQLQPEQGPAHCAATAAEATAMRADATLLLYWAAWQAAMATAVLAGPSLVGTLCPQAAQGAGCFMALKLANVLSVMIGRCSSHSSYRWALSFFYLVIGLYCFTLSFYGFRNLRFALR